MQTDVKIRPFDDGLYFDLGENNIIKPHHVHFECKTDNAESAESCDFRLFALNREKTLYADNTEGWEQKEIVWG